MYAEGSVRLIPAQLLLHYSNQLQRNTNDFMGDNTGKETPI